jgi:anti-anti-sigma factor
MTMTTEFKVIQPKGIFDSAYTVDVRRDVNNLLKEEAKTILLDCQDVTFMNSSGLGVLVAILKDIRANNAELYICSLQPQVKMIFELTRMERIFKIYVNRNEFEEQVMSAQS